MKPGPGMYDSTADFKKAAPRYGFGSEVRTSMAKNNGSPAPGNYEPKKFMGADSPAKSMSPKLSIDYKAKNDKLVPGPGSYEFHLRAMKTAPSWQLGTSKRGGS